jgi:hypothetical protein
MGRDLGHSLAVPASVALTASSSIVSRSVLHHWFMKPVALRPLNVLNPFIPLVQSFDQCWFGRYVLAPAVIFPCQKPIITAIISY